MPRDSCRKKNGEVEAFIKNKNKYEIGSGENNLITFYNSIKIIPITTNNSVMLMNHFNLFFNAKEIDIMLESFLLGHVHDKLSSCLLRKKV